MEKANKDRVNMLKNGVKISSCILATILLSGCVAVNREEIKEEAGEEIVGEIIDERVEEEQETASTDLQPSPPEVLKYVTPTGVKTRYPEVVVLEGKTYALPEQWIGQRVDAPQLTREDLTQIPTSLTYNKSKLFLLPRANEALQEMAAAALQDGVQLMVHSSYRSEWYQRRIFSNMFNKGRTFEDVIRYVAPPGYSEHALGTVVDFYPSNWRFAATDTYKWLKQHGAEFHFYETYPETGSVPWEAWHWRWIAPEE